MRSAAACLAATPGYLSPEERYRRAEGAERAAKRDLDADALRRRLSQAEAACHSIGAWLESENRGPDYGSLSRDTHPHGEAIWRRWFDKNLALCDLALSQSKAVTNRAKGEGE